MIKITVSPSLKGSLVLSAIRGKLCAGATFEITEDVAGDADVLWARRKGYISFGDSGDLVASAVQDASGELEFVNNMKGGLTVPFLGRTLSPGGRFILKHGDKSMDAAMKMVAAGYLSCSASADITIHEGENAHSSDSSKPKKVAKKSTKRSRKKIQPSDEMFDIMNTEVS
jgi:hypothetical protein